jgi:hypothetical protein
MATLQHHGRVQAAGPNPQTEGWGRRDQVTALAGRGGPGVEGDGGEQGGRYEEAQGRGGGLHK